MENENINQPIDSVSDNPTETPIQPQPQVAPSSPKPFLNKKGIVLSILGIIFLIIVGGGSYLLGQRNPSTSTPQGSTQPTITPEVNNSLNPIDNSSNVTMSNQIRISRITLTYPDQWIPIFAVPKDGKNVIYFAKNEQEATSLATCVNQSSCSNYSLKLEDFGDYAIWQNSTVEDFIKQVRSDIKLDSLQKTTINGRDAWLGYVDSSKTKYQAIIVTNTAQSKSFVPITASTTDPSSGMLEEYVSKLTTLSVGEYKQQNAKDLSPKVGFTIELASSLDPKESDSGLITFILDSLLAPKDSKMNYNYFLYTASTKTSDGSVAGPNYPTSNILNSKYYLLTDNDRLTNGMYGTSQIQIKVTTPETKNLGQYLADPKYCTQDSDCQYRANFCTIGAYNPYHQYSTPWGCGMPEYENLGAQETVREKAGCESDFDVKYDTLKCVNNSCQAINAQPVCK